MRKWGILRQGQSVAISVRYPDNFSAASGGGLGLRCHVSAALSGTLERTAREISVWRAAPGRAREEARIALEGGLPSVEGWFLQAPHTELTFLMGLMSALLAPPSWARTWAARRVLDGGEAAEDLR